MAERAQAVFRWWFPRGETYAIGRVLFLRGLGAIYLVALLSWWVQVDEIAGSGGLIPLADFLDRAGEVLDQQNRSRWGSVPTLFWFGSGDGAIHLTCLVGVILAALLLVGLAPGPCLVGLWAIYLSLLSTGGAFMSFQWDILLVEAGFLAIWLAPWGWRESEGGRRIPIGSSSPPLRIGETAVLWLAWFLIAKLMFQSGWVKLAWATSAQPEWWPEASAMTYHYFTQPIPNPLAWWMHQLPRGFQEFSLWPMYFVELVLPFFVFLGVRLRLVAALGFAGLMFGILLTGNYTYFNWLTIVLCLPLVADRDWRALGGFLLRLRKRFRPNRKTDSTGSSAAPNPLGSEGKPTSKPPGWISLAWRAPALVLLVLLNFAVCLGDWHGVSQRIRDPLLPWTHLSRDLTPEWVDRLRAKTSPFCLANGYGLFRTMTTERPEIGLEGSSDGVNWKPYDLRWKPDRLDEAPPWVAPHQPRVAWQFWFAALEPGYHPRNPSAGWMPRLVAGLLDNDPVALSFFAENPFPDRPPKAIRGVRWRYEFTTPEEKRETGNWWKRTRAGMWLPEVRKR